MGAVRNSILTVSLAAVGCASGNANLSKKFNELNDRVTILQNERDRLEERVAALEYQQSAPQAALSPRPGTLERPKLKVIRLAPEPERDEPEAAALLTPAEVAATRGAEPASDNSKRTGRPLISGSGSQITTTEPASGVSRVVAEPKRRAPVEPTEGAR